MPTQTKTKQTPTRSRSASKNSFQTKKTSSDEESSDNEAPLEVSGSAGLRAAAELAEREERASRRHAEEKKSKNRARTLRQQESAADRRKLRQEEARKEELEVDRLPAQLLAEVLAEEQLERESKKADNKAAKRIHRHFDLDEEDFEDDAEDEEDFDFDGEDRRSAAGGPAAIGRRSGPVTVVSYEEIAANDLAKSQAAAVEGFLSRARANKRTRSVSRSDIAKGRPDPRFTSRPLSSSKALPENAWRKKKGSKGTKRTKPQSS